MFEFLQSISDFFTTGIYDFFTEAAAYLVSTLMIWWLQAKLAGIEFAWAVAQNVLTAFDITGKIVAAFGLLSGDAQAVVNWLRFPQAVSIIVSAGATRVVMKLIPGL